MGLFNFRKEPALIKDIRNNLSIDFEPSFGPFVDTSMGVRNHGNVNRAVYRNSTLSVKINIFDLNETVDFNFNFNNTNEVLSPEPNVFVWNGTVDHYNARVAYLKSMGNDMLIIEIEQPSYFSTVAVPIQKYR